MECYSEQGGTQTSQAHTVLNVANDSGSVSPISEDLNLWWLLNFDGLIEPTSPLAADLLFSPLNYSPLNPIFDNCAPSTFLGGLEQARDSVQENEGTSCCESFRFNEKLPAQKPCSQPVFTPSSTREVEFGLDRSDSELDFVRNDVKGTTSAVLKSSGGFTFSDRMLRVLSLLKESAGGGILAQVWMPVKQGDTYMLSTCEQPFLLDPVLAGYREISRVVTFSTKTTGGLIPGIPGRVFMSGFPEWTSNVMYYNKCEYSRVDYAVSHEVKGSLAVPIFYPNKSTCSAVLELVTLKEKSNFNIELENICRALQVVDLRMTKAHAHRQNLTKDQKSALSEILDVLRDVCHTHMLPLALTWMPISLDSKLVDDGDAGICKGNQNLRETIICIESACYVNDTKMHGFMQACAEHYLSKGQGIAGKAFQSNHPFFSPDVKVYDIGEYPFAHHARKFGLHAAVAIRLRSTYTGDDDFILEFFLPVNCKGSAEQQLLLNNLSVTMHRICRSLRTVLDAEEAGLAGAEVSNVDTTNMEEASFQYFEITAGNVQSAYNIDSQLFDRSNDNANIPSNGENMRSDEQVKYDSQKPRNKKHITSVKDFSLNVLQKYFAGSLKHAAFSLGVCPTTLKRICRQHGISRWPSRKIKKVNHSLKKIQHVINSVQGVEGTFQYDPKSGRLVAAVGPENQAAVTLGPMADDPPLSSEPRCEVQRFDAHNSKPSSPRSGISGHADIIDSGSWPLRERCTEDSGSAAVEADELNFQIDFNVGNEHGHSHPSSSYKSNSSSDSASSCQIFKESSKKKSHVTVREATYVVKATYKADIVRFKLLPSMAFLHLYEEVGRRFGLQKGTFQLKYRDDDEEWVMLTNGSDLEECIEVLESTASPCIRLQVCDVKDISRCLLMDR